MMSRLNRRTATAVMIAALVAVQAPALAQDLAPLQDRVERLERSINDLKQFVHRGKPLPSSDSGSSGGSAIQDDGTGVNAKITALEAEVRALTNRVEEINFTVRRLDDRMTKLVEDVDFRLTAIERNMGASGGAPVGSGTESGGTTSSGAASGPRSLGTVSRDAVNRVPQDSATTAPRTAAVTPRTPATAPAAALEGTPEQRYDVAFGLLQSKRFGESEAAFAQLVADHPQHELAGNAQYWLGETYYIQGDYESAARAFLEGYKNYRSSSKSPDNLLKLGMTLAILNQNSDACAVFAELKDRYPNAQSSIKRRAARESKSAGC